MVENKKSRHGVRIVLNVDLLARQLQLDVRLDDPGAHAFDASLYSQNTHENTPVMRSKSRHGVRDIVFFSRFLPTLAIMPIGRIPPVAAVPRVMSETRCSVPSMPVRFELQVFQIQNPSPAQRRDLLKVTMRSMKAVFALLAFLPLEELQEMLDMACLQTIKNAL